MTVNPSEPVKRHHPTGSQRYALLSLAGNQLLIALEQLFLMVFTV